MNTIYMQQALDLAAKANPFPNPKVGCVIVKDNKIIGQCYHKKAGSDHAEIAAIKDAISKGNKVENATLYVTLEPCNNHGKTPPCVDRLIKEKVKKVIIATVDPNPKTHGQSIQKLKDANIEVRIGLLEEESDKLILPFFVEIKQRPFILLKVAMTADGFIAKNDNKALKITGKESQHWNHCKRREVDAILLGKTSAIVDNPQLSSRLEDTTYPIRILLDTKGTLPITLKCLSLPGKTIILTVNKNYKNNKADIIICKTKNNKIDINDALKKLKQQNIKSIMVEGGSEVIKSFIDNTLVDQFALFIGPNTIGQGIPFYKGITPGNMIDKLNLRVLRSCDKGEDRLILAKP